VRLLPPLPQHQTRAPGAVARASVAPGLVLVMPASTCSRETPTHRVQGDKQALPRQQPAFYLPVAVGLGAAALDTLFWLPLVLLLERSRLLLLVRQSAFL
jgi:hypothetical protein